MSPFRVRATDALPGDDSPVPGPSCARPTQNAHTPDAELDQIEKLLAGSVDVFDDVLRLAIKQLRSERADLYAACEAALLMYPRDAIDPTVRAIGQQIRAALAKARGE